MYQESDLFRERCKASSVSKYKQNVQHRNKVIARGVSKYREDIQHRQSVTNVRLSRKQKMEKSKDFGFVMEQFVRLEMDQILCVVFAIGCCSDIRL